MMPLESMPASIARRVRSGSMSMARRRSWRGERRIGARDLRRRLRGPPLFPSPERDPAMQLGVHIGYWGLGLTSEDQLEIVKAAEAAGYDSVWTAEAYGSDAATVLAWLAGQTTRIKLGAGVFQIPGRTPAMTAMTAVTIDHLSHGRMLLGIGASGPQVSEGWHGVRFAHQLGRTREYVAIMRMALSRERLEFHGEHFELPLPDGPGK